MIQVYNELKCPVCACTRLDIRRRVIVTVLEHVEDGAIQSTSGESDWKDKDKYDLAECMNCRKEFRVMKGLYSPWDIMGWSRAGRSI